MTIVSVVYFQDSFLAISDSRITVPQGPTLEKFSKLFSYTYKFTTSQNFETPPFDYHGEVGLAFAGSTLFGLSFSNMFARTIAEMHSHETSEPPTFSAFTKIAKHCALLLCEYVLSAGQFFEVLIFGFDPRTNDPTFIHLALRLESAGPTAVATETYPADDKVVSIGTGAKHLPADLPKPSEVPLEIFISKLVASRADPATGGDIQVMELRRDGSQFFGTTIGGSHWDEATYAGVNRANLGSIDGFRLGRTDPVDLNPYGAIRNFAGKANRRLRKSTGSVPNSANNFEAIMGFLAAIHSNSCAGTLEENYTMDKATLISGEHYFAKICSVCWLNSPSIHSPAAGHGFSGIISGSGSISVPCQFCGSEIRFISGDFVKETLWKGK